MPKSRRAPSALIEAVDDLNKRQRKYISVRRECVWMLFRGVMRAERDMSEDSPSVF